MWRRRWLESRQEGAVQWNGLNTTVDRTFIPGVYVNETLYLTHFGSQDVMELSHIYGSVIKKGFSERNQ